MGLFDRLERAARAAGGFLEDVAGGFVRGVQPGPIAAAGGIPPGLGGVIGAGLGGLAESRLENVISGGRAEVVRGGVVPTPTPIGVGPSPGPVRGPALPVAVGQATTLPAPAAFTMIGPTVGAAARAVPGSLLPGAIRDIRSILGLEEGPMPFPLALPGGAPLPAGFQGPPALPAGGLLFSLSATCPGRVTPNRLVMAQNPVTGSLTFWRHVGRPVLFAGDLAHCKRVEKIARKTLRGRRGR